MEWLLTKVEVYRGAETTERHAREVGLWCNVGRTVLEKATVKREEDLLRTAKTLALRNKKRSHGRRLIRKTGRGGEKESKKMKQQIKHL